MVRKKINLKYFRKNIGVDGKNLVSLQRKKIKCNNQTNT